MSPNRVFVRGTPQVLVSAERRWRSVSDTRRQLSSRCGSAWPARNVPAPLSASWQQFRLNFECSNLMSDYLLYLLLFFNYGVYERIIVLFYSLLAMCWTCSDDILLWWYYIVVQIELSQGWRSDCRGWQLRQQSKPPIFDAFVTATLFTSHPEKWPPRFLP